MRPSNVIAALLVLGTLLGSSRSALGTSVVVPDDVADLQTAVSMPVDTVYVRPGNYPGVFLYDKVILRGIDASAPAVVDIVTISPSRFGIYHELGNLLIANGLYIYDGFVATHVMLRDLRIDGGIHGVSSRRTGGITLRKCVVNGDATLVAQAFGDIDSSTFNGRLLAEVENLYVRNSIFNGLGEGNGIGGPYFANCVVSGNTVRNFETGIYLPTDSEAIVVGNVVEHCPSWGIFAGYGAVRVDSNVVRHCGSGLVLDSAFGCVVRGNHVGMMTNRGIRIEMTGWVDLSENLVWGAASEGVFIAGTILNPSTIVNNTFANNGGSGLVLEVGRSYPDVGVQLVGNIGSGNGQYGTTWLHDISSGTSCNTWYGNTLGATFGSAPAQNLALAPLYCDEPTGNFHLRTDSPLLSVEGCSRIGAREAGCDSTTGTLVSRWEVNCVGEAIRIRWASSVPTWLERAEDETGPWLAMRQPMEREGTFWIVDDATVVGRRTYWYRLMGQPEGRTVILAEPLSATAGCAAQFGLRRVWPNPVDGPLNVELTVGHAATIEVALYDVQGRLVQDLLRRTLQPGVHALAWPSGSGSALPSGVYVLRYRYPGGEDVRRLIWTR